MGKVYLIGAGPGDKGLLTLKGHDILIKADVVVYDRLVSDEIMELIPEKAVKINVGKNVGNHAVPQERINEILAENAGKFNIVVRLKGGDPFVFGRGGEELEHLVERDIPFEVVSGITSSISAPMYAGIPVTHRDFCSSFHVITGHAKKDEPLKIDFKSLVNLNGTLIFMMSVSSSVEIANGLINAGMSADMPVAFIENATRTYQNKYLGKLCDVENMIATNNICSPAVFVVGKVCELSEKFDWFSNKPLRNKDIIVTQPKKNISKLADLLIDNGTNVRLMPMIKTSEIRPLEIDLSEYNTVIFTSSAGVKSYFEDLFAKALDARTLSDKKIACVGSETAATLKSYGIIVDFIPSYYDGETLAKEMIVKNILTKDSKVALLRAKQGSKKILEIFEENDVSYTDFAVYETENLNCEKMSINKNTIVTFTSKSCVEGFAKIHDIDDCKDVVAVCIGRQTETLAKELGFITYVSEIPTVASMVKKILEI